MDAEVWTLIGVLPVVVFGAIGLMMNMTHQMEVRLETNLGRRMDAGVEAQRALDGRMDRLESGLNGRMDRLESGLNGRMDRLDERVGELDRHLGGRIDALGAQLNEHLAAHTRDR